MKHYTVPTHTRRVHVCVLSILFQRHVKFTAESLAHHYQPNVAHFLISTVTRTHKVETSPATRFRSPCFMATDAARVRCVIKRNFSVLRGNGAFGVVSVGTVAESWNYAVPT